MHNNTDWLFNGVYLLLEGGPLGKLSGTTENHQHIIIYII